MQKIGFIGLGIMGKAMVFNLLKKGYSVDFYARHKERTLDVIEAGAVFHDNIRDAVCRSDVVITMVGGPKDVESLYYQDGGILESVKEGTYLIDMTSSSPSLAQKLYQDAKEKGLFSLDVPVTGGDVGAREGTLSLMVGGDKEVLDKVYDVLNTMGSKITYMGEAGAGQNCKLVNQIMCAGSLAGMCEGLAYASFKGLNLKDVLAAVSKGAAGSRALELYGERVCQGDMQPGGALCYLVKDLKNARSELSDKSLELKMADAVLDVYAKMESLGQGGLGVQAMYAYLLDQAKNHE